MAIFNSNDRVGEYRICNLIKSNLYTETYRSEDDKNNSFFVKVFNLSTLPVQLINQATGMVQEIEYCRRINHRNIISYVAEGKIVHSGTSCQYYVTPYFKGSLLSDLVIKNGPLGVDEAIRIFSGITAGLSYLHNQQVPLCHNDLDPSNIMISDIDGGVPVIIDLGHLSHRCCGQVWFDTHDLDLFYHSNETKSGIFDEQGDIFSACAVLFFMLTGEHPWNVQLSDGGSYKEKFQELWTYRRSHPIDFDKYLFPEKIKLLLSKGLNNKPSNRFRTVDEMVRSFSGISGADVGERPEGIDKSSQEKNSGRHSHDEDIDTPNAIDIEVKRGGGNGFADIAGMNDLKSYLQQKVIMVIKDKETAEKYRLVPPNGMLLYGPPGCGKTFFAEKFAEETGFNFMLVRSSDVGSSLVHGTQEKIKKLFKKAEKNSPIVLCFDEFDAIVPNRGDHGNEYVASEVNEFLSQMNNCSNRGIFIIATSNRPDKIDPAVLRTGRIDKQVYVPLPDLEARRTMFELYLDRRPVDDNLDLNEYAQETDGYIASDIAFIVNDAAMTAAFARKNISNEIIVNSINAIKPSLRPEILEEYSQIHEHMEGIARRVVIQGFLGRQK